MWRRIAGSLIIILSVTAASGGPDASSEPILKTAGKWGLVNINDGIAAALVARSADGTNMQLSVSCRPDEPNTQRLLLAYYNDAAVDNSMAIAKGIYGAHLQNLPNGRKLPIAFLGMSPHFDKVLNHKSAIFFFSFDRNWLPEIWKGNAMRLNFSISSKERRFLPNVQIPLSNSLELIMESLQNCTKHPAGEEKFDFDEQSMEFGVHGTTGDCEDCGWIFARGVITDKTAAQFQSFMSGGVFFGTKSGKVAVRLHSPGSSLRGALALGRVFRKYGVSTRIGGRDVEISLDNGFPEPKAHKCESACAYAFLGGVERQIAENGGFGVHQFYREDALFQPTAPVLSAKDYAEAQRLQSQLFEYVNEMNADTHLVSLASSVPPWGQMRYLDKNELKDLKVVTASLIGPEWSLQPTGGDGLLAGITLTQHGESFQLIVHCTQGSNSAQIILVDYNKFLRENATSLNAATTEGKITIKPKNIEIKVGRSSPDRLAAIAAGSDNGLAFLFLVGRDQILRFWNGSSVIFTVPTGKLASEIAQGVEFPIANSHEMISLVLRNCSKT